MKQNCWYEMSFPREINYAKSLFLTLSTGRNMFRIAQRPCKCYSSNEEIGLIAHKVVHSQIRQTELIHSSVSCSISPLHLYHFHPAPRPPTKQKGRRGKMQRGAKNVSVSEWASEFPAATGDPQENSLMDPKFPSSFRVMIFLLMAGLPNLFFIIAP